MVVADTSPLNYLVLIDQINLLPELYGRILIPASVLEELSTIETPQLVRNWATNLPGWIEVSPVVLIDDAGLTRLHAGELDAILLALNVHAEAVLLDERRGRQEAEKPRPTTDRNAWRFSSCTTARTYRFKARD